MKIATFVLTGILTCSAVTDSPAQISYQWDSMAPGLWDNASNWNPIGVPGATDDAVFDLPSGNLACHWNESTPSTQTTELSIETVVSFINIGTNAATHTTQTLSIPLGALGLQGVNLVIDPPRLERSNPCRL